MGRHPTIHDVAERAGVSKSLVSLVIRGAPNVSDQRRAAVLEAAAEIGYRPNLAAQSLVRRKSQIIGVLASDLHNPFFHEVIDGVDASSTAAGYRPVITSGQLVPAREKQAIDILLELRVDGLILLGPQVPRMVIEEISRAVPTVAVGLTSRSGAYDSIAGDERIGAGLVVDHLVDLGHRHISHVHGGTGAGARARRSQYERAMKRHGLEEHIRTFRGDFTEQGGADGMERFLGAAGMPTAVFMANDFSAMGALEVLDARGIKVPKDLSLVGYDNLAAAGLNRIRLTTVDQPRFEIGQMSMTLLLERIEQDRTKARHVVVPPRLVVRATSGPPRE